MYKKTLVYGLSRDYYEHEQWIKARYEITGCCDQDRTRLLPGIGIPKEEIKKCLHEFDTILVTADPVSIVADLVDEFGADLTKIQVLFYELVKDNHAQIQFFGDDNEDAALLLLFNQLGYSSKDVRYLEIGTNDPVRFNDTFNFYLRNTKGGYLVDPLPAVGYLAQLIRPKDKFVNAAVSSESKEKGCTFYACKSSTVSSLHKAHHRQWDGQSHNDVQEIQVKLLGINDLLASLDFVPDFLLVDAEGEDERILHAMDYESYRPKVIMTEADHMSAGRENLIDFMKGKGYIEYATIRQNIIFMEGVR